LHAKDLPQPASNTTSLLWALLLGNFVIGTGVMAVPGTLNEIAASLQVSVAQAGQLITAAAITVAVCAPTLAAVFAKIDRRVLLTACLLWYAALHAASALAPGFTALLVLRVLSVVAAAVFTPQAAAVAGMLATPEKRGQAITTVFLGWSISSVLGSPMSALIGGHYGWSAALWVVSALSVVSAALLWRAVPSGVRPPALSRALWLQTLSSPVLLVTVLVTALSATGQFTLFAYLSPYVAQILKGSPQDLALVFMVFGGFGVLGSYAVSRMIDRVGAARAVLATLCLMALSMVLIGFASTVLMLCIALIPWGLGCFSANSAQQARLVALAPAVASVSVALNTSALYLGQGVGSALGGWMLVRTGLQSLHGVALAGILLAIAVSAYAAHLQRLNTEV
jgi:predicted MFS family arabinose efflux permease